MVADALSRRYTLVSTLSTKLFGLEYIKDLYASDLDFSGSFERAKFMRGGRFSIVDDFLCFDGKLCVPRCSLRELLVRESHNGGLMGHFSVQKTLSILQEYFFWPHMKRDVARIIERCVRSRKAKSRSQPHGL